MLPESGDIYSELGARATLVRATRARLMPGLSFTQKCIGLSCMAYHPTARWPILAEAMMRRAVRSRMLQAKFMLLVLTAWEVWNSWDMFDRVKWTRYRARRGEKRRQRNEPVQRAMRTMERRARDNQLEPLELYAHAVAAMKTSLTWIIKYGGPEASARLRRALMRTQIIDTAPLRPKAVRIRNKLA